jgi:hypothetical protein
MELKLTQWLAGEFENQTQALSQPAWFVNLKLWHRPLPFAIAGNYALFAEQAPILKLEQPYRQRVLVIQPATATDPIMIQYYAFKQPQQWRGSGITPQQLESLSLADLEKLPGCVLAVTATENQFSAKPFPNAVCQFYAQGNLCEVELGFAVTAQEFFSYDKGIDPETKKPLWGALLSPYQFQKVQGFTVPSHLPPMT